MRFCPQCGTALMTGAKFCVECGAALSAAPSATGANQSMRNLPITTAFVGVFVAITVVGLLAAGWVMLRRPPTQTAESGAQAGAMSPPRNASSGQLPPGHPRIELPAEAKSFIAKVEQDAHDHPNDVAVWNKLGGVSTRAAMFDQSYYAKAAEAYGRALSIDPDNLEALRGIGDVDYDTDKFDQAIAAYEHYLKKKPDDPEVITDLGTMYLYTGNPDQAIAQYHKALRLKPDMFQAYFNLGVAFAQQNKTADAKAALMKAQELAPDDTARNQVKDVIAKIAGGAAPSQASGAGATPAPTFQGEIEQLVRTLPIAGPKVGSVQWTSQTTARVLMNNFPMDQMPPFAKDKFMTDLKTGIDSAKKDYKIAGKVEVQIVDGASGRVMETVTQ
jgi:tetratricopeptide (TPR) repeat protein